MKKQVFGRKLGRERDSRRALFRSLISSLTEHGSIKTTKSKAKSIQLDVDRLISLAKKGSGDANKRIYAYLGNNKKAAKKVMNYGKSLFKDRKSGFTRIVSLGRRRGDLADMVRIEFVEKLEPIKEEPKTVSKKKEMEKTVKLKDSKKTEVKKSVKKVAKK